MGSKEGFRIYEINDRTKIPKRLMQGISNNLKNTLISHIKHLDFENKTYAIRIGKKGLE